MIFVHICPNTIQSQFSKTCKQPPSIQNHNPKYDNIHISELKYNAFLGEKCNNLVKNEWSSVVDYSGIDSLHSF